MPNPDCRLRNDQGEYLTKDEAFDSARLRLVFSAVPVIIGSLLVLLGVYAALRHGPRFARMDAAVDPEWEVVDGRPVRRRREP